MAFFKKVKLRIGGARKAVSFRFRVEFLGVGESDERNPRIITHFEVINLIIMATKQNGYSDQKGKGGENIESSERNTTRGSENGRTNNGNKNSSTSSTAKDLYNNLSSNKGKSKR